MRDSKFRRFVAVAAIGTMVAGAGAADTPARASAPGATARGVIAAEARAAGIDPDRLFALEMTIDRLAPDGTRTPVVATVGALLDDLDRAGTRDAGILGTPEVMAGDTLHVYTAAGTGSQLGYNVSTSALAPSTPPVLLPPPLTTLAFDVGGPVVNIKGSYDFGLHTVGTVLGSNVDTASPGGNGDPIWIPTRSGGTVQDRSIDFAGHAVVVQGEVCLLNFCVAVGTFLGTGAATFDSTLPVGLPTVP